MERQLTACADAPLEASDPFTTNTYQIAYDLQLNRTELAVLRFSLIMGQSAPLRKCTEMLGSELSFTDAVEALAHILELDAVKVRKALIPDARTTPYRSDVLSPIASRCG